MQEKNYFKNMFSFSLLIFCIYIFLPVVKPTKGFPSIPVYLQVLCLFFVFKLLISAYVLLPYPLIFKKNLYALCIKMKLFKAMHFLLSINFVSCTF